MNIGNCISIIGSPGSGKSTLANALSILLQIPHIRISDVLDDYAAVSEKTVWSDYLANSLSPDKAWIADGFGQKTIEYRLKVSDTIIFLNLSVSKCLMNACKRGILNLFSNKTSTYKAYRKNFRIRLSYLFSPKIYIRIIRFHRKRKPALIDKINKCYSNNVIILHDRREIKDFLFEQRRSINE